MKPVIGISTNWAPYRKGRGAILPDSEFSYLVQKYYEAIYRAGGVPLLIPTLQDTKAVFDYFPLIDALVLSGGGDIDATLWETDHISPKNMEPRPIRDKFEFELFLNAQKPILAVCRGLQLITVKLGGDIYQDLSEIEGEYFDHTKRTWGELPMHEIAIEKESLLHHIIGHDKYNVNSSHHQTIKRMPEGFSVVGRASLDGQIEAFEGRWNGKNVIAVQWHPEHMPYDFGSKALFNWIVEEGRKERSENARS
ncbi:MAG: gamma-glutamyl-gamma-aminobutyrate hydrolase family protein [Candidatus Zixiibacteriota bacterium]